MATKKGAVPKAQGIRYRTRADGTVRGYEVRYRDRTTFDREGQPVVRGKTFRTLEEAKAFQRENDYRMQKGTYIAPEREATTWKQVADEWMEAHQVNIKPRTIQGYRNTLGGWLSRWDRRPISSITRRDLRDLLSDIRAKGLKEETEHRIFTVARMVLAFAVAEGYVRESPATTLQRNLRSIANKDFEHQTLTAEQADAIIANIAPGRNRLFALLAYWTGMRGGELAGLRVRNIDRLRNKIQVEDTIQDLSAGHVGEKRLSVGTTKTKKSKGRRIPIPRSVMDQVGDYIDTKRKKPDDFLFSENAEFFYYQNWSRRHWAPACRAAGLAKPHVTRTGKRVQKPIFRPYDLRHTRLSMWAAQGVPPHVLKDWAGHTNITTTMNVYVHVNDADPHIEAMIERLYSDQNTSQVERPVVELRADEA